MYCVRSAIEVVRKMMDKGFVRKLRGSESIERVFEEIRAAGAGDGDKVYIPPLYSLSSPIEPLLILKTVCLFGRSWIHVWSS